MRMYRLSENGGIKDKTLVEQLKCKYSKELEKLEKEGRLTLEASLYTNNVCSVARRVYGEDIKIEKNNGIIEITYRNKKFDK